MNLLQVCGPTAMSERSSHSSDAMLKFLKDLVESQQGISLQTLTGHLSQLPPELRAKYGCSAKALVAFLRKYPKVFIIRNDTVCLATNSTQGTSSQNGSSASAIASASNRGKEEDINSLSGVKGTVYRLFPLFGFISSQSLVRTSVYFDIQSFENAHHSSLFTSGLQVGDSVIFDAKIGPDDCTAKFRASRVTRATTTNPSPSPSLSPQNANDEEVGDCGSFSHLVDQHGLVEFVKSSYGFIKFGPDESERAFFHVSNVDRSLRSSIKDLQDRFGVDDKVRFNAKLSKKPSERVKWEATTVYLCESSDRKGAADFQDLKGNEVFMTDHDWDTQDQLHAKVDEYQSRDAGFNRSPTGNAIWDESSAKADSCDASVNEKEDAMPLLEWERRHKLFGQQGFFYPVNESVGAIRFGPGRGLVASAAVHVTYRNEKLMDNFLLDVANDQEVSFDAVRAEDNTWIATLVWIGKRPVQPRVGNGEDVLEYITNPIESAMQPFSYAEPRPSAGFDPEESGSLGKDAQDGKNSFILAGFERGIDQGDEAARGPSRVPSVTALPQGPSRGSLGSNSLSVAGLLAASPAVTSPSTCMKSSGVHGQSSTRECAPGASCLSACVNEEGLRRVAKMVNAKMKLETLSLRVTLRDVGVQTVQEDLIQSAYSRPGGRVPALRSSSTQTILTGKITSRELFIN